MNNLKVSNMTLNGRLLFEHKLNEKEIEDLMMQGNIRWTNIQEKPMVISAYIEKKGLNAHGKKKNIYISIWPTGSITIVGVTSKKEADEVYERVIKEIKEICPGILKNVHQ